jgi:hypothetical protein
MANQEHVERLKRGVAEWNSWRRDSTEVPDLSNAALDGANVRGTDLKGANLWGAWLAGANLSDSDLSGADLGHARLSEAHLGVTYLSGAKLRGADLVRANLGRATLLGADLRGADLSEADLTRAEVIQADLSGAHLKGADLTEASIGWTVLGDLDLSVAKGLDKVIHEGPSIIGIDTIYKSQGKIPHVFLRGAGVPDSFIEYMASLVGNPIEFYSCFISYSSQDQAFADRLHADLQANGVRCWFAPHKLSGGKKVHEQIDEAIRLYDRLLLILSEHSMGSEWVRTEIAKARKREVREKRRMLFPLRLVEYSTLRDWECFDADTGKDSAREIREHFIPDFGRWKEHDRYREAFDRLLRDLKTENTVTSDE